MGTYMTIQGDTWDYIAFKLYGDAFMIKPLLDANTSYLDMVIFPSGMILNVPELAQSYFEDQNLPPWRDNT